jgi:hypothetical protein
MSYLAGPLTRTSIKKLMDPKRGSFEKAEEKTAAAAPANPMAMPSAPAQSKGDRPAVGPGVVERFMPVAGSAEGVEYRPHLLRAGTVRFSLTKADIEGTREVVKVNPMSTNGIDWETEAEVKAGSFADQPAAEVGFDELPGFAMNADNYKQVEKDFSDWLYHNERVEIFECPALKAFAGIGESEAEFRARLGQAAREMRDEAVEKLRDKVESKLKTLESRKDTAERTLEREKGQANAAKIDAGMSVLGSLLGGILGGRRRSAATAVSRSSRAYQQHRDVAAAEKKVEAVDEDIVELKEELEEDIAELSEQFDPQSLELETETLKPTRTNVEVDEVALLWLPYDAQGGKAW